MLEQVLEILKNNWELITGGGLLAIATSVGRSVLTKLPGTIMTKLGFAVDGEANLKDQMVQMADQVKKTDIGNVSTLKNNILNAKSKLESTVLSEDMKQEYLNQIKEDALKLSEEYGIVIKVPNSLNDL